MEQKIRSTIEWYPPGLLPEEVCGTDERVQVDPTTSPPYNYIASLKIMMPDGKYGGTGFLINLPKVKYRVLLTSAHNLYNRIAEAYPDWIELGIPGEKPMVVTARDFRLPQAWIDYGKTDDDYGIILLAGEPAGFGWTTSGDAVSSRRLVSVCGYPTDKLWPTMWTTGGPIESVTLTLIRYMMDSVSGQSGSPVWTWWNGYWTCVGIHGYGGCPNVACRITLNVIQQILIWADYDWIGKAISSDADPEKKVCLRMDGSKTKSWQGEGSGVVDCQYEAGPLETLNIIPTMMPPSLATQVRPEDIPYAIASTAFSNVFLRMDGRNVTPPIPPGGAGKVNCQYGDELYERFYFHPNKSSYNIESVDFPKVYLRMDGTGVTPSKHPGGVVNCQFAPPGPLETFSLTNPVRS